MHQVHVWREKSLATIDYNWVHKVQFTLLVLVITMHIFIIAIDFSMINDTTPPHMSQLLYGLHRGERSLLKNSIRALFIAILVSHPPAKLCLPNNNHFALS